MTKKLKLFLWFLLLLSGSLFVKINFYKFYSKYFDQKWEFTKSKIEKENKTIIKKQEQGKIFLENDVV